MTYSNHFVMCVLVNGEPQKELANGVVSLPFGSEYALRLRNKNNRRAVVKIYIDGENVSGGGYVIEANSFIDIKRHHDKDRAFKFVSLDSAEAVDFGKNGPNPDKVKGTIEARFHLEKERPVVHEIHHHHDHYHPYPVPYPVYPPKPQPWIRPPVWVGGYYKNTTSSGQISSPPVDYSCLPGYSSNDRGMDMECSSSNEEYSQLSNPHVSKSRPRTRGRSFASGAACCSSPPPPPLQDGCTVEGYSTGQSFYSTTVDYEDTYTSLKVFLQGYQDREEVGRPVEQPVRKTNKDLVIDDLERENEELRRKLAEAENRRLKEKLREHED